MNRFSPLPSYDLFKPRPTLVEVNGMPTLESLHQSFEKFAKDFPIPPGPERDKLRTLYVETYDQALGTKHGQAKAKQKTKPETS